MPEQAKRGFMPSDKQDFSEQALPALRKAAAEICYLISRGYPVLSAVRFVGDHYQFSERQRLALARAVSPQESIRSRKSRQVTDISGERIYIDGFNIIISLEIAFSGSMLFSCMDGTVRDLAGLHGTYRLIPQTDKAIKALLAALEELRVLGAVIYLDRPVSNSGRLRERICSLAEGIPFGLDVEIRDSVDTLLKSEPLVASGDAIILDRCDRWFDLTRYVISSALGGYDYIYLAP